LPSRGPFLPRTVAPPPIFGVPTSLFSANGFGRCVGFFLSSFLITFPSSLTVEYRMFFLRVPILALLVPEIFREFPNALCQTVPSHLPHLPTYGCSPRYGQPLPSPAKISSLPGAPGEHPEAPSRLVSSSFSKPPCSLAFGFFHALDSP